MRSLEVRWMTSICLLLKFLVCLSKKKKQNPSVDATWHQSGNDLCRLSDTYFLSRANCPNADRNSIRSDERRIWRLKILCIFIHSTDRNDQRMCDSSNFRSIATFCIVTFSQESTHCLNRPKLTPLWRCWLAVNPRLGWIVFHEIDKIN